MQVQATVSIGAADQSVTMNEFNRADSAVQAQPVAGDLFRTALRAHQQKVGEMAKMLAAAAGCPAHQAATIGHAATLYDIGKLFVRGSVCERQGVLTAADEAEARTHTTRGHWALRRGHDPVSRLAARMALEHHEHWDGSGYPYGLAGDQISREARMVTICDAYVTLREKRPHRAGLAHDQAMAIMLVSDDRIRPTFFDPTLLAVFLLHGEQFRKWWDAGTTSIAN